MTAANPGIFPYAPAGLTGAPFYTSTDLANWLQIDPSTINAGTATLLAQLASDAIRDEIRLTVDAVAGDEITMWGDNGDILLLPQRPVTAVSSVVLDNQALIPVVPGVSSGQMYDWRPDGRLYRVVYGGGFSTGELKSRWPTGVPVQITYSHGWLTPPSALKSVALQISASAYMNPEMHDQERVGWVEWQTRVQALLLSPAQCTALDPYRRVDF
jgi:hypothetical protein